MKISFNNTAFCGYKNVISNELKTVDGGSFSYLAMQLNDEGRPDLSEWRKIKSMQSEILQNTIAEDSVLSVVHINKNKFTPGIMMLNEMPLIDGRALRDYSIKYAGDESYKKCERFILKAYTLLASLSGRISVDSVRYRDFSLKDTVVSLAEILSRLGIERNNSFEIAHSGIFVNAEQRKTAASLNKYIQKTMEVFFK